MRSIIRCSEAVVSCIAMLCVVLFSLLAPPQNAYANSRTPAIGKAQIRYYSGELGQSESAYQEYFSGDQAAKILDVPWGVPYGWEFLGWSNSSTGTSATYNSGELINYSQVSNDVNFYAIWHRPTVSFEIDGNTGQQKSMQPTHGVSINLPEPIVVKSGFTFGGWRYDTTPATILAPGSSFIPTENVVLHAVWIPNPQNNDNNNGGENSNNPQNNTQNNAPPSSSPSVPKYNGNTLSNGASGNSSEQNNAGNTSNDAGTLNNGSSQQNNGEQQKSIPQIQVQQAPNPSVPQNSQTDNLVPLLGAGSILVAGISSLFLPAFSLDPTGDKTSVVKYWRKLFRAWRSR